MNRGLSYWYPTDIGQNGAMSGINNNGIRALNIQ